jgi:hypothetical protein
VRRKIKTGGLRNETPLTNEQIRSAIDFAVSLKGTSKNLFRADFERKFCRARKADEGGLLSPSRRFDEAR